MSTHCSRITYIVQFSPSLYLQLTKTNGSRSFRLSNCPNCEMQEGANLLHGNYLRGGWVGKIAHEGASLAIQFPGYSQAATGEFVIKRERWHCMHQLG